MRSIGNFLKFFGIIFILCTTLIKVQAQKHDNKWMMGYQYAPWQAFPALDFYFGAPDTIGYYGFFPMFGTCNSICNSQGLLQFYTNGIKVANKYDAPLLNADTFNIDPFTANSSSLQIDQLAITLPLPGSTNEYLIFHIGAILPPGTNFLFPNNLRMSKVDMTLQGGAGEMVVKRQIIINDTLTYRTLNAVKHGNGRDWWVVIGKSGSDKFYSVLVTPNGIDTIIQSGNGATFSLGGPIRGQSTFSPDGSLFAFTSSNLATPIAENKLVIYNFDRCTGEFDFRDSMVFDTSQDSAIFGCAFSPNSRYIYTNTWYDLYQIDLLSLPFNRKFIASFDGFTDPFLNVFYRMQFGPDNKIYMTTWGSSRYLHVINYPNQPDTLCNFVQHQLKVISPIGSTLPQFPYFRLGAALGSGCDTLTVGILENNTKTLEMQSHFENGNLHINFNQTLNGEINYSIYNVSGQILHYSSKQMYNDDRFSVSSLDNLNNGIYFIQLRNKKNNINEKFIISQ